MDLTDDYEKNILAINKIEIFRAHSIPMISCHFALHYLADSKKNAENIINLINHYLMPNGDFIFTK